DQVIHMGGIDGQVHRYRKGGADVTYVRDRLSEHFSLLPLATPITLDWLDARLAGKPVTEARDSTVWSVLASPVGVRGLLEMARTAVLVALGRPLRAAEPPVSEVQQAKAA
ncbi:lipase family protein, partial [Nocardia cyriacigeorgica]|uniref:lipase family protein n=1 Tax=Nocardia cyriacigeorgica TaxID=135487 RepID=UPI00245475B0